MKPELEETLNRALTDLVGAITQVKDFAIGQLPEVLQQLLLFELVWGILAIVILSSIITLSAFWVFKWADQTNKGGWSASKEMAAALGGIMSSVSFVLLLISLNTTIKILVAPKLYLLEYVAKLIN